MSRRAPSVCPQCGAPLKPTALACPACGSDWQTGWSEGAEVDWEQPDYDELLEKEFGSKPKASRWHILKTLAIALLALVLGLLLTGL